MVLSNVATDGCVQARGNALYGQRKPVSEQNLAQRNVIEIGSVTSSWTSHLKR